MATRRAVKIDGESWRDLMELTREVVRDLARANEVEVTQKGTALDPDEPRREPARVRRPR